jgi:hypothetical protein
MLRQAKKLRRTREAPPTALGGVNEAACETVTQEIQHEKTFPTGKTIATDARAVVPGHEAASINACHQGSGFRARHRNRGYASPLG